MSGLEQPDPRREMWRRGEGEVKALLAELAFKPNSSLTQELQEHVRSNVVEDLIEEIEQGENDE